MFEEFIQFFPLLLLISVAWKFLSSNKDIGLFFLKIIICIIVFPIALLGFGIQNGTYLQQSTKAYKE